MKKENTYVYNLPGSRISYPIYGRDSRFIEVSPQASKNMLYSMLDIKHTWSPKYFDIQETTDLLDLELTPNQFDGVNYLTLRSDRYFMSTDCDAYWWYRKEGYEKVWVSKLFDPIWYLNRYRKWTVSLDRETVLMSIKRRFDPAFSTRFLFVDPIGYAQSIGNQFFILVHKDKSISFNIGYVDDEEYKNRLMNLIDYLKQEFEKDKQDVIEYYERQNQKNKDEDIIAKLEAERKERLLAYSKTVTVESELWEEKNGYWNSHYLSSIKDAVEEAGYTMPYID